MLDLSRCAAADFCRLLASRVGGSCLALSRVDGIFLAEAIKPKYGGIFSALMQYGGIFLAVGGFSFLCGNDFGGGGRTKNMGVNRHITGTAYQDGNFTTGKLPKTTLDLSRPIDYMIFRKNENTPLMIHAGHLYCVFS